MELKKIGVFIFSLLILTSFFGIVSAATGITVTFPNGGENLNDGVSITWTLAGSGTGLIEVMFSSDGGSTWNNLATLPPGSTGYNWDTITDSDGDGTNYKIFVIESGTNVFDTSDDVFTVDNNAPTSSAGPLSNYQNTATFNVPYTATDLASGVDEVELFYRKDEGGWTSYGTFTSSPISFTSIGDGAYDFYTVATDNAENVESKSPTVEVSTIVDTIAPTITDDYTNSEIWVNSPQTVTLSPNDINRIASVSTCEGTDCTPSIFLISPYQLTFSTSQDTIVRYLATDNAGNPSLIDEFNVKLDVDNPIASVGGAPSGLIVNTTGVTATISCSDSNSGCLENGYRIESTNPGTCSTNPADYILGGSVLVTDYSWICAYSKDNAGNKDFSDPVEFNIFSTIQSAIDAASSGDTINIANGTYTPTLTINVNKQLKLVGESTSGVIITSSSSSYGIKVTADDVHMEGFTLEGAGTYGLKIESLDNITLRNLVVQGSGISEVDLNQVTNSWLEKIKADGLNTGGVGIALTNSINIELKDIHTLNNNWGGVGLFDGSTGSTQDVTFSGTNTFEEVNKVYVDAQFGFGVSNIILPGFTHSVENPTFRARGPDFTFYQQSESDAIAFALILATPADSYIQTLTPTDESDFITQENNFVVGDGMSIQSAIDAADAGATINVAEGAYEEQLTIDKSLTLMGDPGGSPGPGPNAPVLDGTGSVGSAITLSGGVSDVVIQGFEITNYRNRLLGDPWTTGGIGSGVLAWNSVGTSNIQVLDNYFHDLGWSAVLVGNEGQSLHSNWLVADNIVEDWAAYGIELTNTQNSQVIGNEITGGVNILGESADDSQDGILVQTQIHTGAGLTVSTLTIDNNVVNGPLIRAGIELLAWDSTNNLTANLHNVDVANNEVSGAERGLYIFSVGANANIDAVTVSGNTFDGNDDGIQIRDFGGGSHGTITITNNSIINSTGTSSGIHILSGTSATGILVNENTLTNNLANDINNEGTGTLNAEDNWWGSNQKSTIESEISGLVEFTPWAYNSNVDTDHDAPTSTINSPAEFSWQNSDFNAELEYSDTGGSGLADGECKYKVVSSGDITEFYKSAGDCSGNNEIISKLITVGGGLNCRDEGTNICEVFVKVEDNSGNEGTEFSRTFSIDFTDPTGSISIESGATYTDNINVELTLTQNDNLDTGLECRFSNNASTWSSWEVCTSSKAWILTSGDGSKTVYIEIKDDAGNMAQFSDDITLDTLLPEITGLNNFSVEVDSSISVTATVTDTSGINNVVLPYTVQGGSEQTASMTPSGEDYTGSIPSQSSSTTISYFVIAQDNAGNLKTSSTFTITVNDLIWELDSAWNLVSVPKNLVDNSVPTNEMWYYDGTGWSNPTTIEPGIGYWINDNPLTELGLDYAGECSDFPRCLLSGKINIAALNNEWNMVGLTTTDSKQVKDAFGSSIYNDTHLPVYEVVSYNGTDFNFMGPDDIMNPGEGYWVYIVK